MSSSKEQLEAAAIVAPYLREAKARHRRVKVVDKDGNVIRIVELAEVHKGLAKVSRLSLELDDKIVEGPRVIRTPCPCPICGGPSQTGAGGGRKGIVCRRCLTCECGGILSRQVYKPRRIRGRGGKRALCSKCVTKQMGIKRRRLHCRGCGSNEPLIRKSNGTSGYCRACLTCKCGALVSCSVWLPKEVKKRKGERPQCRSCSNIARRSTSGIAVKGVYPNKSGTYVAKIKIAGKCIHLGTFQTISAAASAYINAVQNYRGRV